MYLDYDHLHLYVKNYNRYKNAIKRLELEIEELETMINPKGINYDKPVSASTSDGKFKIQCFHEINEKQDRMEKIERMVKSVDNCIDWVNKKEKPLEFHIITERRNGKTLEQIAESLNYSINAIDNRYRKTINEYLVNYHA